MTDLVLNWKEKQKLRKPTVIDQVLSILGALLQMWFVSLGWLLQVIGQSSIFIYGLAIVHLCKTVSLSVSN